MLSPNVMLNPEMILTWLEENTTGVRRSRLKTLAAIIPAAMTLCGLGVLTLGRCMNSETTAKHNIKRVCRFLGNEALEVTALARGIFHALAPMEGPVLVLADWTDVTNGKLLVFALPCNGRSVPFYTQVVPKKVSEGEIVQAEEEALRILREICQDRQNVVIVADRGFGNHRWLGSVTAHGFHFVQRLSKVFYAETEHFIGNFRELDVTRGPAWDWGYGTVGEGKPIAGRLVSAYDKKAKEPWFLLTDLDDIATTEVVSIYRRRWWIETFFRDKKNLDWGMGLTSVELKDYRRYERLFYIIALAFIFLNAHGAVAESEDFDRDFKANTRKTRVINLLRLGFHYIRHKGVKLESALNALKILMTMQSAPNWG
jgi:hypothetical protein